MAEWFETKVKFLRQMDNGLVKQITEQYLVDSMSFTEAEGRVMTEATEGMREVTVVSIKRSAIKETVMYGDTDMFFKVKVSYTALDEVTEKEKKINTYLLVNANDAKEAYERTEEHLKEMLVPFTIPKIDESPIIEVYQYQKGIRPGLRRMAKEGTTVQITDREGNGVQLNGDGSVEKIGGEFDMEDAGDFAESGRVNNPNESVIDCAYTKQEQVGKRAKQKGKIHLHGSIRHLPEKPSPALDAPIGSKLVHYKLTEGYRRRVAAGQW